MTNHDFDALHGIHPGQHCYQFYKSFEDYSLVLSAYFRAGLEKGESCLWLISQKIGLLRALGAASENIPGFDRYLESGLMDVRPAEDWYLENGRFSESRAMDYAGYFIEKALSRGAKVVRAAGDAAAIPRADWGLLEAYEQKVSAFVRNAPVIGLCAYPIHECSLQETRMVIQQHDHVLIARV